MSDDFRVEVRGEMHIVDNDRRYLRLNLQVGNAVAAQISLNVDDPDDLGSAICVACDGLASELVRAVHGVVQERLARARKVAKTVDELVGHGG